MNLKDNPFHYSIATRVRNRHLINLLNPTKEDKILDVGCGVGYFSKLLSEYGANVSGIDINPDSVNICKSYVGPNFYVGNASRLDFDDNSFDKILCSEVLEHLKDDKGALDEIYRILKPNGILVLTVPCTKGVFGTKIKNIMHDHHDGPEKHEREGYTKNEISELVNDTGLKVKKFKYAMLFFVELLMGATKLVYSKKTGEDHLDSQADVLKIDDSLLFNIYRFIFPVLFFIGSIDDFIWSKLFPGHMIILKATKD